MLDPSPIGTREGPSAYTGRWGPAVSQDVGIEAEIPAHVGRNVSGGLTANFRIRASQRPAPAFVSKPGFVQPAHEIPPRCQKRFPGVRCVGKCVGDVAHGSIFP